MSSVCNALPAQRDYEPCAYQTHTGTLSVEAARASLRRGHPAGRYQARRREPNRPTLFHLARRHGHRRGERQQAPRPGRRSLRRPAGPKRSPAAPHGPDHSASDPLARARDRSKAPGRARRLRSRGGRRLAPAVPVTPAGSRHAPGSREPPCQATARSDQKDLSLFTERTVARLAGQVPLQGCSAEGGGNRGQAQHVLGAG
jgi:hypothetical protein